GPLTAFTTSEAALVRYNAEGKPIKLVAAYPSAAVPTLDYPYVILPDISGARYDAAQKFLEWLSRKESAPARAGSGVRSPAGDGPSGGDAAAADHRTSAELKPPTPVPDGDTVDQVLNGWAAANLSGRVQVLIDVSGSMNDTVPGTGKSRMELTMAAAVA